MKNWTHLKILFKKTYIDVFDVSPLCFPIVRLSVEKLKVLGTDFGRTDIRIDDDVIS